MKLVNTPYDDVFRTLLNDCTNLVIPIINEVFGEHYLGNEKIVFYPNEHFLNAQDGKEQECITDTCFTIQAKETKKYHLECQSTADNSMLVRMFEYDTQIALDDSKIKDNILTVKFPNSAILFLRCDNLTPETMKINIETSGGNFCYDIPVMKSQKYKIEEIFEKGFLFLIPFYIFLHESNFKEYDTDKAKLEVLMNEYEYIKNQLEILCLNKVISEYTKCTIIDMSNKVLEHIARKHLNVREGVKSVMGGKILEYEAKAILMKGFEQGKEEGIQQGIEQGKEEGIEQGIEQGMAQGIKKGKLETYIELIRDGFITLKEVANRLNMNEEDLKAQMK